MTASRASETADAGTWAGRRLSYDDFLREAPTDGRSREWVDGRVIELSPFSDRHQDLQGFLTALLRHWVEAKRCGLVRSPFQMKTAAHLAGREPDVLFLASEHLDRLHRNHIEGPADLAVEIVSPESQVRDTTQKLREYEGGGVLEFWLIDPEARRFEVRVLENDGRYRLVPADATGIMRSRVLEGLWLRSDWLWQEPLPPLLSILKEWKLI